MSRFGRKVIRRMMNNAIRRAGKRHAMRKMVNKGKHVFAINYAKPQVGGIMLT